jgi:AsmA protein
MMKRIAKIVLAVAALLLLAAGLLLVFPPKGLVKEWLVRQVKTATGRDLAIAGPMSLRLLPRLVVRLENVTLSNPPGGPPGEPLFAARAVLLDTALWPLVRGRRTIDRVSLEEPRVSLSVDPKGEPNWVMRRDGKGEPFGVRTLAVAGGSLSYREGGRSLQISAIEGSAKRVKGESIAELALKAGPFSYEAPGFAGKVAGSGFTASASAVGPAEVKALALKGRKLTVAGAAATVTLQEVDAEAKSLARDKVGAVAIKAAALLYRAGDGSAAVDLTEASITAASASRGGPLEAAVAFVWNKDPLAGSVKVLSPGALIDGSPSAVSAHLAGPKGKLAVDGSLALAEGTAKVEGKAGASTASLRALARWLGAELPNNDAFGAASIESEVKADGRRIVLENARLAIDATRATGSLTLDLGAARPHVAGTIKADSIDADSFLRTGPAPPKTARVRALAVAAAPTDPPVPVKDALKAYMRAQLAALAAPGQVEPKVTLDDLTAGRRRTRALPVADEWSDEAIDFSALKALDADLTLSVGKLTLGGVALGVPELKTALRDGALSLAADNLAVQGGRLSGTATVDARESRPKLAARFKAQDVDAAALFASAGQNALVAGKVAVEADLRGTGNSQRKLVETLTGRIQAETRKGAIVGYDFSNLLSWLFGSRRYDPSRRTPFDRLNADIALANGVASKSSVQVAGSVLGVTADGRLQLPSRQLDYRARISVGSWGPVLLRIFGEWEAPSVAPDWFASTRSLEPQVSLLEVLKDADLEDPELARLAGEVLAKARGKDTLPPRAIQALEGLKARAEGQKVEPPKTEPPKVEAPK